MLVNLVVTAQDVGAGLFGICELDIRKTSPFSPFHTRAMVTGLVGLDRSKSPAIWYDERNIIKDDYDFALEHLKRDRFVWKDCRYFLAQDRNVLAGGNLPWRTDETARSARCRTCATGGGMTSSSGSRPAARDSRRRSSASTSDG